jgi:NAD+ kinase
MRVGVLANIARPGMHAALDEIETWAHRDKHTVAYDDVIAKQRPEVAKLDSPDGCDIVLALGGDGTLLRAAHFVGRCGVPVLGVNLGSLGFLTEITPSELGAILPRLTAGDYVRDARAVLAVRTGDGAAWSYAVNELTIDRGGEFRAIEIKLEADGRLVCRYVADGLIVATPTGSTAYALSAGGPITVPQLRAIVVAPVAPHTLAQRPMVFPDSVVLRITSEEPNIEASVVLDGRKVSTLRYGESCEVRRADFDLQLVRFPERDFYDLVRTKLHWGVDPRHAHRDDRMA